MDTSEKGAFALIDKKSSEFVEFRSKVLRPLRGFARRAKLHAVLSGFSSVVALLVVAAFIQMFIDKLLVLGVGPRLVLLLLLAGGSLRLLYLWALRPLGLRAGPPQVASILETRFPQLRDRLVSAVAFATGDSSQRDSSRQQPPSYVMIRMLMRDAAAAFTEIPLANLLSSARLRRLMAFGLLAGAIALSAAVYAPAMTRAYIDRDLLLRDVPWPSDFRLSVEGFKDRSRSWPMGDELTLVATAHDRIPAGLAMELLRADGASVVKEMGLRGERQFVLDYGPLDGSLKFRFLIHKFGVDDATDWYDVKAVERPGIRDIRIGISPPAYSQLPAYALATGQMSAEILRGSSVSLAATTNKPVQSATLFCGNEEIGPADITSDRSISASFTPSRGGSYHFNLVDTDQLVDVRPVTCTFQLLTDPPPKVRLSMAGVGDAVVATAILPLAIEAEDNLGIRAVDLVVAPQRDPGNNSTSQPADPHVEALPDFTAHQTRYTLRHELPLMPYSLKPGDQISLATEARDYQPSENGPGAQGARGPHETKSKEPAIKVETAGLGRSPSYSLRIITPEELLAELGRRESEWRREFELVIKAQEQLKTRVMNLNEEKPPASLSTELAAKYGQEERAQRQLTNRVKTIKRQFEQILAEMRVNQIDQPTVRRRLENIVIEPLGRLISTDMARACEQLEQLRMRTDAQLAGQLESTQTRIVESMYAVLAGMLKWEGYNEAVSLLRDIIRLQSDVSRQTQTEMEQEIERMFDDPAKKPKRDKPTSQPQS
jgi:hypothetical protein